jgi:signal transduction histidine kinase
MRPLKPLLKPLGVAMPFSRIWNPVACWVGLLVCVALNAIGYAESAPVASLPDGALTNILQVRTLISLQTNAYCYVRLQGVVLWVSPVRDELILQDETGGVIVRADFHNQPEIQRGEQILVQGSCLNRREELFFGLQINNDGIHPSFEKSGSIALSKGWHPISVEWFNGPARFELEVDCMGPGMPRQRPANEALARRGAGGVAGTNSWLPGLDCRCYEGDWKVLPDFSRLPVAKTGVVTNFGLQFRTRDTFVGLAFSGFFLAPRSGEYTFWLRSDDGSKLQINDQTFLIKSLGKAALPAPRPVIPGQIIPPEQEYWWGEMEGIVTHVSEEFGGASAELTSDTGRAYLKIASGDRDFLKLLLHSRINAVGICQNARDIDGETVPSLLIPDLSEVAMVELSPTHWADYPVLPIGSLVSSNSVNRLGSFVHISGVVVSNLPGNFLVIADATGRILAKTIPTPFRVGDRLEVMGQCGLRGDAWILRNSFCRQTEEIVDNNITNMPSLNTAVQVKTLNRLEAERGYPVKIQGVITASVGPGYVIQDSTAPIFTRWTVSPGSQLPKVGEYWEITGNSYMDFAPNIKVNQAVYLGAGVLPEPLQPTMDELINGSFDVQYVELEGIVIAAADNRLTLLTREGNINVAVIFATDNPPALPMRGNRVKLEMQGGFPVGLEKLVNARIHVRGVNTPTHDFVKRMASPLLLYNASLSVDDPPPAQMFETPLKHAADFLFFDAHADVLSRVKIAGQVLHMQHGEYFLVDGTNGFRFESKGQIKPAVGNLVEVVGFPDISGPSPVLHEALVRLTGTADLPAATRLSEDTLMNGKLDATLVCLKSRLIGLSTDSSDQIMELQTGTHNYIARLAKSSGLLAGILPGSQLELTGTYAGHGGDRAAGRDIDSFELLLNSPGDIHVLAHPSWWTFSHTMTVLGGMMFVILAALVWITLLHRQVTERTWQLTSEIKGREQAEYQRALEGERARIASDLHDELGAALTEIQFLGATESRDLSVPLATRSRLEKVSLRSRQMVSSLDEIVWAINPDNDFLPNLADYLCQSAEEFFRTTEVRCRLDMDESLPMVALTSEIRHNLSLVVREALNNVAKHSKATEVWLRIHWKDGILHVIIEDNGCGFNGAEAAPGNGLVNMCRRLEKIGGRFEVDRGPDSGTVCRIWLPFASK